MEYRFGSFRLVPAARELWDGTQLKPLPPRIFDCLKYLIEHRTRAIGHDELVSALWGRVDIGDAQVSQLVMRARRAIDDNSKTQQAIRTISGFGYRWVMPTEEGDGTPSSAIPAATVGAGMPAPVELTIAPSVAMAEPDRKAPSQHRRPFVRSLGVTAIAVLFAFVALYFGLSRKPAPSPLASSDSKVSIAVLPLEVDAPSESSWVHLGAMDLIANRLRSAGLSAAPSESVMAAVHTVGEPLDAERLIKLRQALDAVSFVQGSAIKSANGWTVKLATTTVDGLHHTSEAERPDMTDAARQAADLLLASLGHAALPDNGEKHDDVLERLQRAQAALLSNQLDTARSILSDASDAERSDPRVRLKLARIEQRAGQLDQAQALLNALLEDPAVKAEPSTHAQVLTSLGFIAMSRNDCVDAERQFDAAFKALPDRSQGLDTGAALAARGGARACLQHIDAALDDLDEAGPMLEAAGDRFGFARLNNHFGLAEYYRHRPAEGLAFLRAAADQHESLGDIDNLHHDLSLLIILQTQLMQWPDALATSERLFALRKQIDNAAALYLMTGLRARVLMRLGHYGEAGALLRTTENEKPDVDPAFAVTFHEAKAELAWALGDALQALAEIERAWQSLPPEKMRDDEDVYTILLHQRASIAIGRPVAASPPGAALPAADASSGERAPAYRVAQAEWAAHLGQAATAETYFHQALASTDAQSVPISTTMVADAYARWLLVQHRADEARTLAGRLLPWADHDFDCALLQVAVFHALGQRDAWAKSLKQTQSLAGERKIPPELVAPPD